MMMNRARILQLLLAALMLASCKKDTVVANEPAPSQEAKSPPSVVFSFRALVNGKDLVPNTAPYSNASGDSFTVTKLNYYISNIKLKRDDGFTYVEPESYHLVRHVERNTTFTLNGVNEGNYTSIEFLIGVDSLRNVSGAQTGALDPANEMFWDWSTGYIFYKLDGSYTSLNNPQASDYSIHIGGFAGQYGCIKKVSFALGNPIVTKAGVQNKVSYNTIVEEVFKTPNKMGFDVYYGSPMSDKKFRMIADNYSDMFVVDKVEN